jgi:hypothetical protein
VTGLERLDMARAKLLRWRERPVEMVREEFKVEPDAWQQEVLHAFANPDVQRIAMKACKGPGKTAVEVWCGLNFLATRPYAKIGATSITGDNLDVNLWAEFSKWMQRSQFFTEKFSWSKTRIENRLEPENWFISKRTWPKSGTAEQQADALAGLHADYVMWIGDESGGYPQGLMVTMEAILSSCVDGKILQGGNPTHTTGPLYRACTTDRALWTVITITGDPDDPKRSPRIGIKWARQQIAQYGRENPWVMVNVLGQFPPSSINALLGVEDVEAAMRRSLKVQDYDWAQKRLGIDVARFGDDRTVIFPRQGLASFRPIIMRNARTTDIAARAFKAGTKWGAEMYLVDDTGHWGHGVIDNLIVAGAPVIPIVYSGKAISPRYRNRRAEFWMKGAEAIKAGAALPFLPEMVGELTEPTYTFLNGVFVLEEKDQIKERLGFSPDLGDAYMQTYALEDMPSEMMQTLRGVNRALRDADPYGSQDPYADRPAGRATRDFDPNQ